MENALGEVAIIGEKERPLRLKVEPPDVEKGVDAGKVVLEGRSAFRIEEGRHDALGLVEEKEEGLRLPGKRASIDEDHLVLGIDTRSGFGDNLSIHGDRARRDQLLGLPPGGDSPMGEDLVEPEATVGLFRGLGVVGVLFGVGPWGCHVGILYSHSMVEGGLGEISKTTRLIPGTVAIMRCEIRPRRAGSR